MAQSSSASSSRRTGSTIFAVCADPEDPHALLRIVDHFAQRGLSPDRVSMQRTEHDTFVTVEQPCIEARIADIVAEKLRSLVCVRQVVLTVGVGEVTLAHL